jgi:hypothetical protein
MLRGIKSRVRNKGRNRDGVGIGRVCNKEEWGVYFNTAFNMLDTMSESLRLTNS